MSEIEIRKVENRIDKVLEEGRREEEVVLEERVVYIDRVDEVLSTLTCDCDCNSEELDRLFATNGATSRRWDCDHDGPWVRWAKATLPWDKYKNQDRDIEDLEAVGSSTWGGSTRRPIWQNTRRVVYAVWFWGSTAEFSRCATCGSWGSSCGCDGGPTFEVRRK